MKIGVTLLDYHGVYMLAFWYSSVDINIIPCVCSKCPLYSVQVLPVHGAVLLHSSSNIS